MILTPSIGSRYARILSVGSYRGSRIIDNDEMCTIIGPAPEWIEQRTDIQERRWAVDEETSLFMATATAHEAIGRARLDPSRTNGIICSTASHFQQSPSLAVYVAHELGLNADLVALDALAACISFCHGASIAESPVRSGAATNVLVIDIETLGRVVNLEDRATMLLFSDSAGAAIVGPNKEPAIGPVVWGSDGSQTLIIQIQDWIDVIDPEQRMSLISMDGRTMFRWATIYIATKTLEVVKAAGITPEELDVFIPHQVSNRITDLMLRHLKLPENVVVSRDIRHMDNSSVAPIPPATEALLESNETASEQTALIIGFGAGFAFADQAVVLP